MRRIRTPMLPLLLLPLGASGDSEEPAAGPRVERDTSTSVNRPFSPATMWSFSPLGYMVGGVSSRYSIDLYHPDGRVARIERVAEPVAVQDVERADQEARTRWSMRQTQPDWTWNGPAIPDRKPAFQRVYLGRDGRLWVQVHRAAERVPDEELEEPADGPDPRPVPRWREPIAFDLLEPAGTYLGQVRAPRGFSPYPTPVFGGDRVWVIVRDELDVQYLTRFRVSTRPAGDAEVERT